MPPFTVIEALDPADREACYALRKEVFCGEQAVDLALEFDGLDDACRHYLARNPAAPLGTARTRPLGDGRVKIERVAVLRAHRGRHIGLALMEKVLADARADGHREAVLHSQTHAGPFYSALGFAQVGDGFEEAGIPHIRMTLAL